MTPEKNEDVLLPAIMDGTSAVRSQSRIPYDFNYYGDFCFASREDRRRRLKEIHIGDRGASNDALDKTIPQYQKSIPFRFMDLPAEIRKLIFDLVASTFLCFDTKSQTYINHVEIRKNSPWEVEYCESHFKGSFDEYLESRPWLIFPAKTLSPEKRAIMHSEYVKDKKDYAYIHKKYPGRDDYYMQSLEQKNLPFYTEESYQNDLKHQNDLNYENDFDYENHPRVVYENSLNDLAYENNLYYKDGFVYQKNSDFITIYFDWKFLEWFRKLANVSRQFRLEFGSAIWARSSVHCDREDDENAFVSFLDSRPGVWQGIKQLSISIGEEFIPLIDLISQRLDLEYFTLNLGGTKSEFIALASGEGPLKALTNIRELKVTKGFAVTMESYLNLESDQNSQMSGDTISELCWQFRKEWEPKITTALMPNTLRSQKLKIN